VGVVVALGLEGDGARFEREAVTGFLTPEQRQRYLLETPEEAQAGLPQGAPVA
jgi:hypothetical protein